MKTQRTMNHNTASIACLGFAGLLAAISVLPAGAQSRYLITDLGTLPGLADSYVWADVGGGSPINNRGHVAVYANNTGNPYPVGGDSSFLWTGPGEMAPLPGLPGATDTAAMALNDRDQIVGASGLGSPYDHAVLWEHGMAYDLGLLLPDDSTSWAVSINNHGDIAGVTGNPDFRLMNGVVWYDRKIHQLPSLPGAFFTEPNGINDRGQIVGESGPHWWSTFHAVLWEHDKIIDLGALGGGSSLANASNNQGQIVGQAQVGNGDWHASSWQMGAIADLGRFGSDPNAVANAVNSRGQIVGSSEQNSYDLVTSHALLWEHGAMQDLQTQIPAHSDWVLQQANGINDRGQIAGIGLHNGQIRAFLLTPRHHE